MAAVEWSGPAVVVRASGWRPCEEDRVRAWSLVAAARAGDRAAFGVLWQRYVRAVEGAVRGWVRDDATAEDVTSETFLTALRSLGRVQDRGVDVLAWLLWLARERAVRHRQRACVRREVPIAETFDGAVVSEHGDPERVVLGRLDQGAVTRAVRAAVAQLPAAQRVVVQMCDLEERAISEAAAVVGRAGSTVRERRLHGRRELATVLAPWAPPTRPAPVRRRRVSPPPVMPANAVAVQTSIESLPSQRSPFRGRVQWIDPDTNMRRSLSRSCGSREAAQEWINQTMATHATSAAPDQVDAVESGTSGWVVAA